MTHPITQVICNPVANQGSALAVPARLQAQNQSDPALHWVQTNSPEDISRLTLSAVEQGYEKIVFLGSDGTVHAAVNALLTVEASRRPVIGVIPAGSGNDFAFSAGLNLQPEKALQTARYGQATPIDVGEIRTGTSIQKYWINTTGIVFDSVVVYRPKNIHIVRGFAIYALALVQTLARNHTALRMHIQRDGIVYDENLHFLVFCNGKREGGGFLMAPQARPDDGWLDFLGIQKLSRPKMLYTLPFVAKGTYQNLKEALFDRFKHMEVHSPDGMIIHVDGEMTTDLDSPIHGVTVQVMPGAFQLARTL